VDGVLAGVRLRGDRTVFAGVVGCLGCTRLLVVLTVVVICNLLKILEQSSAPNDFVGVLCIEAAFRSLGLKALVAARCVFCLLREAAVCVLYKRSKTLPAAAFCVLGFGSGMVFSSQNIKIVQ
jgi:hypothetical protein